MILDETHEQIRDAAEAFARERVAPVAEDWEEAGRVPTEIYRELGTLGFMGLMVPEAYGGAATDNVACAIVLEALSAASAGLGTGVSGHNSVVCSPILGFGTEAQRQRWLKPLAAGELLGAFCLTEPQGGSDAAAIKTRAVRHGDGWLLNGSKAFITSGGTANVAIVFAVTDPEAPRGKGISAFVVPTDHPGYVVERVERKMGQKSNDTCQIAFRDLDLPADALLGELGQGYRIALSNLEGGRIGIAAQAVGIARAAYEAALAYAKERVSFGKPIIEHQAVGFRLAEMATRVEAARELVFHAAALRDAGRPCFKEACMAKLFASDMAEQVCSDAIQTFGGYGYIEDFPVSRYARDARVTRIYEGANDIQKLVISRAIAAE